MNTEKEKLFFNEKYAKVLSPHLLTWDDDLYLMKVHNDYDYDPYGYDCESPWYPDGIKLCNNPLEIWFYSEFEYYETTSEAIYNYDPDEWELFISSEAYHETLLKYPHLFL